MKETPKNEDISRPDKVQKDARQYTLNIDAGTIVLIVSAVILFPLLLTGFISH